MKAIVVHKAGPYKTSFVLENNFPIPPIGQNEARVRVAYAGLAFPDVLTGEGKHVHPLGKTPRIMGREIVGQIVAIAFSEDSPYKDKYKVGDWIFGSGKYGSWCEYATVKINEFELIKFTPSKNLQPKVVAGFALNYGTSWHALVHQGEIKKNDFVLILGASGGIGLAAIDIAKALGAKVIACASSGEKLAACKEAGADYVINYSNLKEMRKEIESIVGGKSKNPNIGVDIIFDAVGGDYSEVAMRTLRFGGRHLVLGFASGATDPKSSIPKVPLNLALLNERKIVGVLYGTWKLRNPTIDLEMIKTILQMIDKRELKPLVVSYPVRNYMDGLDDLMNRKSIGKIVFDFESPSAQL